MSDETHPIIALAVGAGAGYALWHFFGDRILGRGGDAKPAEKPTASTLPAPAPPPPTPAPPPLALPPNVRPCQIQLDAKTLTAEGKATNIAGAVSACRVLNTTQAQVTATSDSPAATLGQLVFALGASNITTQLIKK
jgi:hypothetical protein